MDKNIDNIVQEKHRKLFSEFNEIMQNKLDELYEQRKIRRKNRKIQEQLHGDSYINNFLNVVANAYIGWFVSPNTLIDDAAPQEYILKESGNIDNMISLFVSASIEFKYTRIGNLFEPYRTNKQFLENVMCLAEVYGCTGEENKDYELIALNAVAYLGDRECPEMAGRLVGLMFSPDIPEDLTEEIAHAILPMGNAAIEAGMRYFEGDFKMDDVHERLLVSLSDLCNRYKKSPEFYKLLKTCFMMSENKGVIANCFARYDNGRAVAFLRGYVEKNLKDIEPDEFFEIKVAVEELGGNIQDLEDEHMEYYPDYYFNDYDDDDDDDFYDDDDDDYYYDDDDDDFYDDDDDDYYYDDDDEDDDEDDGDDDDGDDDDDDGDLFFFDEGDDEDEDDDDDDDEDEDDDDDEDEDEDDEADDFDVVDEADDDEADDDEADEADDDEADEDDEDEADDDEDEGDDEDEDDD